MPARVLWAQGITPSDVEQQVRASLAAYPGIGFGWRTRNPRVGESREHQLETIRPFFASVEYYRITDEEIHTAVDGDVGLAWGFFTEDFQVRGRAPERIRVRFTTAFKREGDGLRQVLFHRDAQLFDDQRN
jgi:hypothetical protein